MKNPQDKPAEIKSNVLVIGGIVLIALILILVSRVLLPKEGTQTQEEIDRQIAALASPSSSPEPAADPTLAPGPIVIETEKPQCTEAPTAEPTETAETGNSQPAAYLFIILDNRVWGIEPLGEEREVTVDQGNGVVNVIHLLPDGFFMASSTCDNQLCVSEGAVTVDNYQRRILGTAVLCLPHHLDLELVVPSHTPDPNAPDI